MPREDHNKQYDEEGAEDNDAEEMLGMDRGAKQVDLDYDGDVLERAGYAWRNWGPKA